MKVENDLLKGLNPAQKDAVIQEEGPFLVLAGAGSGKTRVLTQRIIHMLAEKGTHPGNILAVTFTNKAASEMKNRIQKQLAPELTKDLWIGTFHGICNRLLRFEIDKYNDKYNKSFVILDSDESLSYIKDSLKSLNIDDKLFPPKRIQYFISEQKNNCKTVKDVEKLISNRIDQQMCDIYAKYQEKLELSNSLDFDDLLLFVMKLLEQREDIRNYYFNRFKHVLVDEFQDTNSVQYNFLKHLVISTNGTGWQNRSFCAVGDIDQSIYSWRGADFRIALNFQKDFPGSKLIKLEDNYRSTNSILELANSVIQNNQQRIDKNLKANKGQGDKINVFEAQDEIDEGRFITTEIKRAIERGIKLSEIAIVYRTNAQSRAIEDALLRSKLNYQLIGGIRFYERMEIKNILAYLRVLQNSQDASSLKRIINVPRRGIGASTISTIEQRADKLKMSLYIAMSDLVDSGEFTPKITEGIHQFIELMDHLRNQVESLSVPDLIRIVIEESGYRKMLEADDSAEAEARLENLRELVNVAEDFLETSEDKTLPAFLSQVSLVGDADSIEDDSEKIKLMTIHASKGLEFPIVFITGLEEGVFPHMRSLESNNKDQIEEERRLLYVAITRAEDKLYLTHARRRRLWGVREFSEASRFFYEMPENLLNRFWGGGVSNGLKAQSEKTIIQKQETIIEKPVITFTVGEEVKHKSFGIGSVVGMLGSKNKKFYAVEFPNQYGKKIVTPEHLQKI